MKIYIASSWKNQHAVEMLTTILRDKNHEVFSFVENNHGEQKGHAAYDELGKAIPFEEWVYSDRGLRSFDYDSKGAMESDLVIYISPSGKDAAAECGMAFAKGVPIIGLMAKGEDFGLMRLMMDCWCFNYKEVLNYVQHKDYIMRSPYA